MSDKSLAYLNAMGIDVWQVRDKAKEPKTTIEVPLEDFSKIPVDKLDWESLRQRISGCTLCNLHQSRTQTVFGIGNPQADLMFIGEAPVANEDLQGEPFVGRAGQLLNSMLEAIDLNRSDIFIANILKCRPPENRDPLPEEVATCTPYLLRQIEHIKPKLIVALGRIAAQFLLNTTVTLGKLREQTHHYHGIPLITTYHPAYLLRSPTQKAKAWEDLVKIKRAIN